MWSSYPFYTKIISMDMHHIKWDRILEKSSESREIQEPQKQLPARGAMTGRRKMSIQMA